MGRSRYVYEPRFTAGPYGVAGVSAPRRLSRLPLLVVGAAVVLLVAFLVANASGSCSSGASVQAIRPAVFSVSREADVSYALDSSDLLSVADTDAVEAVSLGANAPAFSIGPSSLAAVNADIAAIEQKAPCGFVFMDVGTGRAIAYHAGRTMYVASASKAPLVFYATTRAESEGGLSQYDRENAEAAIVESDNDAFFELCSEYFDDGYLDWLLTYGIVDPAGSDDYFPEMSPRALGAVWADIRQYVNGGSDDAEWLAGLFAGTEESYIRSGLQGTGAVVLDKAGWMYDSEVSSVTDAGIVEAGGRSYLMVIVTEQSEFDQESRANDARLARDLFDIRGLLAPHLVIEV